MRKSSTSTYSFVAWISSLIGYFCFISWAFLPEALLHSLGITYYPSRYYAVAIPAYAIVIYILSGLVYIGYNLLNTLDPADILTVYDRNANADVSAPIELIKVGAVEGIPAMHDIDPIKVSTILKRKRS